MTNDGTDQVIDLPPSDVAQLRADFPGWSVGAAWTSVNSGPDRRRFWAVKEAVALSAWSAEALRHDMERQES